MTYDPKSDSNHGAGVVPLMSTEDRCTCDGVSYGEHPCPYQSDVHDDGEFRCTCCPWCEQNCVDDI